MATLSGSIAVVSALFVVVFVVAGPSQPWAQPATLGSCDGAGGVRVYRAVPGRQFDETVCVPRSVWFAQQLAAAPAFTDRQLADYARADVDPDHVPDRGAVVASYRGALVRVEFPCSSFCDTPRIIYLTPQPGKACADVGGDVTTFVTHDDIGSRRLDYCVPKVVSDAEAQQRR
jgi:hypothetical protein